MERRLTIRSGGGECKSDVFCCVVFRRTDALVFRSSLRGGVNDDGVIASSDFKIITLRDQFNDIKH